MAMASQLELAGLACSMLSLRCGKFNCLYNKNLPPTTKENSLPVTNGGTLVSLGWLRLGNTAGSD